MGSRETQENPQARKTQEKYLDVFSARDYSTDLHQKEKEQRTPKQNFPLSRDLVGGLTPSRPVQGNLFSILEEEDSEMLALAEECRRKSEEERQKGNHAIADELLEEAKGYEQSLLLPTAKELEAQGKLFSIISDGINAGAAGKKLIVYIARELYRQSNLCGGVEGLIKIAEERNLPIVTCKVGGKRVAYPYIHLSLNEAAKWIKGANNSSNRNDIKDMLERLDRSVSFIKSSDTKKHIKLRVLSIEMDYKNEYTGQRELLLMLRPIFFQSINTAYVTGSESSSRLLPELKKDIEVNLWLYLLELLSFKHEKGYPIIKRSEEKVEARVIPSHYIDGSKKKRLTTDFNNAVAKMIKGGLLTDEGITYEIGKNGVTRYYVFHLNPHYNDTTTPLLPPEKIEE